ncbi:MAG: M42 family peptidase [Gemmatimonadales bacterium]|nr:MAG: M42 family peptidase [Gemmatimonadales bacterium]
MSNELAFLERLLEEPGPSGFEGRPARIWKDEAGGFAERVWGDVQGNSFAAIGEQKRPRVMLAGHMDEIGLQITHINEKGFLYFGGIGGWDSQVLVGQRVRVMGREGDVPGVIGKKPIHLMKPEERKKVSEIENLWIDLGAASPEAVAEMGIRVGDPAVVASGFLRLAGDRIASRAIDNRVGAYVVLEALRLLAKDPAPDAGCVAVATVQEEIGFTGGGARSSAFSLDPDVALVVDVTFSTDVPDVSKNEVGEHELGGGPVLSRGSAMHPMVFDRLVDAAEAEEIPYSLMAAPRASRTDADGIFMVRSGVPTGLVSIPNRYMHSPSEVVSTADLMRAAQLLAGFVRNLSADASFVQG